MSASEPTAASPANHWKRRPKSAPMAPDQARRQGEITQLAFILLGRESAIAFLNGEHAGLGGRPLAVATASAEGRSRVEAELGRMNFRRASAEVGVAGGSPERPASI